MTRKLGIGVCIALASLFLPALASAQSQLAGIAKDSSGGVLPGVLVEASSPAIIEGVKTATTDETGSYRMTDLRPGVYTVTFTLSGFQVVKTEGIQLAAEQTRTVNVELKLGAVSEVLTVSGTAPVVDVQNATRVTSLERSVIDNLPLGNNIWEMAQVIPGIDIYATFTQQASSVGGSYGASQVYMSTHGQDSAQNVVMVDGMSVSGLELNGTMQAYFNNDMNSEVSYQTSGIGADRSGGGVTVNMIPREGGNRFSGNARISMRPHSWIANNAERFNTMGLTGTASLKYLADETISQGGPVLKNKLWFFASYHQFNTSDYVDGTFFNDGEQGYDDQRIMQGSGRLTWQASPRNKLSGYYDKTDKARLHSMSSGTDPETAAGRWYSPNYATGNVKLTSTWTSKLLFEGGYSFNREYRDVFGQEGVRKDYGSPEWYANASRAGDGARITAPSTFSQDWPGRDNYQGSISYVTGQHQIKAGVQWQTGTFFHNTEANGDLTQNYNNRVINGYESTLINPLTVTARNTPVSSQDRLNADIGIYAQDSWRVKRLTLNAGLRWEHINAQNDAWDAPEGRFVPARHIAAVENVPDWYDWAPRFSAVYDLFGNSRTAVKYAVNRYNRAAATALANGFNTLTSTTRTLSWVDLNGDDIAQGQRTFSYNPDGTLAGYTDCVYLTDGCEINIAGQLNPTGAIFGTPAAQDRYQGYPRGWNFEQLVEIQHALTRRLSLTGSWTRGSDRDLTKTVNQYRQAGDYVPVTIYNPIDGTPITAWSIKDAATQSRLNTAGANVSYVEPGRKSIYQQMSLEFRMRPYAGAQIFGGFTMDKDDSRNCGTSVPGFVTNPADERFCDDYNLSGIDDHGLFEQAEGPTDPGGMTAMAKDFRVGVSLPLPWYGVTMGITYLNNDSGGITPTYSIVPGSTAATSTRYPDGIGTTGGASATRKIAAQPAPPCPTAYGCVPGAFVLPTGGTPSATGNFILPTGSTLYTIDLYPGGRVRRERLNQVDLKLSKTFRVKNVSILPTFEAYNLFNEDTIFGYQSGTYATSTSTYLIPSATLQSRIIGFGAQVRW